MQRQALRTVSWLLAAGLVLTIAPAAVADSQRRAVDVTGKTRSTGSPEPGTIEDRGTIRGRPFGVGRIKLLATFEENQTMSGEFKIRNKRGTASGTMQTDYVIEGDEITFTGTAEITRGTGRYRGIKGKRLEAYDHNTLDGQNGTITLQGFARF